MALSTQIRSILRRIVASRLRPLPRGETVVIFLSGQLQRGRLRPRSRRVVPIVGWPRPNPIPNPVATPAVIHPAARTLGARHFANVDDPASEIGFRSADLLAAKNPIRRAGRSRLLTFWTVLPGSKLPVSTMSIRWTMVAPTPNTATAITVASRKPSRRPMAMIPRLPTARLAKPTSS